MHGLLIFAASKCDGSQTFFGLPAWYKYIQLQEINGRCEIVGGFQFPSDLAFVALALLEIVLRLAGLIAIAFVIYGGFQFVTSQGDPEAAKKARQTIINAVIGLVIALFATALVAFAGTRFV